jgi:hypothetical protein
VIDRERRIARVKTGNGGEWYHSFVRGANCGTRRGGAVTGVGQGLLARLRAGLTGPPLVLTLT